MTIGATRTSRTLEKNGSGYAAADMKIAHTIETEAGKLITYSSGFPRRMALGKGASVSTTRNCPFGCAVDSLTASRDRRRTVVHPLGIDQRRQGGEALRKLANQRSVDSHQPNITGQTEPIRHLLQGVFSALR